VTHKKAVAGIFQCRRVVALRPVIQERKDALAAAIRRIVKNVPVATLHVDRLQDEKITGILDAAAAVARRFVEIDDDLVQAIFRIDLAIDFADEFFVGAGDGKFVAAGEWFSFLNDEAGDHG
jgi:hypothetical protein